MVEVKVSEQQTESQFSAAVIDYARSAAGAPPTSGRHAPAGDGGHRSKATHTDLICARAGRVVIAELKAARAVTTDDQDAWPDELDSAAHHRPGPEVYLWRPVDWPQIEQALR